MKNTFCKWKTFLRWCDLNPKFASFAYYDFTNFIGFFCNYVYSYLIAHFFKDIYPSIKMLHVVYKISDVFKITAKVFFHLII